MKNIIPEKAYKNLGFLNSPSARHIRIQCEMEETRQRFEKHRIQDTIVLFGSARTMSTEDADARFKKAEQCVAVNPADPHAQTELKKSIIAKRMSNYYDGARELSRQLTEWSVNKQGGRRFVITSGGGPGIMEAANRGASEVKGGRSIGLGISLPFEQGVNPYVSEDLAFEFHYFFTRKYWFLYLCKAVIIFPGGFGTFDELFETLTLVQTKKIKKKLPIVLFGTEYWSKVFNVEAMAEFGTISPEDIHLLYRTDSVEDAFEYITKSLDESTEPTL